MDVNRLIGEVAARHGVRLDPDDPALVLVTLTELMMREAREEFLAAARVATAEFVEAAGRVQEQAGAAYARSVEQEFSDTFARQATAIRQRSPGNLQPEPDPISRLGWPGLVAIVTLLFGAGLILGGRLGP